jgi:hypothetical protein
VAWRAPDLKDDTVLIIRLPGMYGLQESFEIWAPANAIYAHEEGKFRIAGQVLNPDTAQEIRLGRTFVASIRTFEFTMDYKNSLVASLPSEGACLQFIDGSQPEMSLLSDPLVRLAAPFSRTGLIDPNQSSKVPPVELFGVEPAHDWCYYYQKASLARQQQNWTEVVRLTDEALQLGLAPNDGVEWMPFLEGAVNTGDTARAAEIALRMRSSELLGQSLCADMKASQGSYSSPDVYQKLTNFVCNPQNPT